MSGAEFDLAAAVVACPSTKTARRRAPLPSRRLARQAGRITRESLVHNIAFVAVPARSLALLTGNADGLDPVNAEVVRQAHVRLESLVTKLLSGELGIDAYRADTAALTGLGPGLTPTGDDLLVSLAAMAERLAGGGLVDLCSAASFAASLTSLDKSLTTPEAQRMLANAANGVFPVVLADFVEAIGMPDVERACHSERQACHPERSEGSGWGSARNIASPQILRFAQDDTSAGLGEINLIRGVALRLTSTGAHSGADLLAGALALVHGVIAQET